jgi:hypothetical protein
MGHIQSFLVKSFRTLKMKKNLATKVHKETQRKKSIFFKKPLCNFV